jgi:Na+-driven multidrug efflux pump
VPAKVQNMILGGILRSGGRTTYVMVIDMIGTWVFVGVGEISDAVFLFKILH